MWKKAQKTGFKFAQKFASEYFKNIWHQKFVSFSGLIETAPNTGEKQHEV
jgi:hypothetical protein